MTKFNPFTDNWNKWPEPTAMFIFSQAEAKLKQLIEAGRLITDRSYKLLTTCTTLILISLAYIIKSVVDGTGTPILSLLAVITTLILFFAIVILMQLMFPRSVMPIGRNPNEIMTESFFHKDYDHKDITLAVILTEIQSYEDCIQFNENDNEKRLKLFKIALWLIISVLPIALIISFLYPRLAA